MKKIVEPAVVNECYLQKESIHENIVRISTFHGIKVTPIFNSALTVKIIKVFGNFETEKFRFYSVPCVYDNFLL